MSSLSTTASVVDALALRGQVSGGDIAKLSLQNTPACVMVFSMRHIAMLNDGGPSRSSKSCQLKPHNIFWMTCVPLIDRTLQLGEYHYRYSSFLFGDAHTIMGYTAPRGWWVWTQINEERAAATAVSCVVAYDTSDMPGQKSEEQVIVYTQALQEVPLLTCFQPTRGRAGQHRSRMLQSTVLWTLSVSSDAGPHAASSGLKMPEGNFQKCPVHMRATHFAFVHSHHRCRVRSDFSFYVILDVPLFSCSAGRLDRVVNSEWPTSMVNASIVVTVVTKKFSHTAAAAAHLLPTSSTSAVCLVLALGITNTPVLHRNIYSPATCPTR